MVSVSTLLQQQDQEFVVVAFKLQSANGEGEVAELQS